MFTYEKERYVKNWPIDVFVPVDDGKVEKHRISLDLKILSSEDGYKILKGDMELFKSTIVGWNSIADAEGKVLPFSEENRNALLDNPFFTLAAVKAYQQASNGVAANDDTL
ncbi:MULTISPECIES: hypothetical protein [Vibrio]|uniref:hypothetical protein n=1 Tax=Vibrio TaxID=662 RepID=UPI00051CFE83|nr:MULTISPECIES: hypothetical protein [Vibrio]KGK15306.1 hypothetical protein EA24_08150 [Vibrio navarrensis]WJG24289.1 hypothetical protein QSU95_17575 [Vibrio furnissii]